ncbi:hypothetical protein KAZ66_06090 [Candidatus Woesebacteria bacterium]|nr:hypothetical protein [Candidatus Woesebacteria bacterium]
MEICRAFLPDDQKLVDKPNTIKCVYDIGDKHIGVWVEDIFLPYDMGESSVDEWRSPRLESTIDWLTEHDPMYAKLYTHALAQYPGLEGCTFTTPENASELKKVQNGLGLFSVVNEHIRVVKAYDNPNITESFVNSHKAYIRYLSSQIGVPVEDLRRDTRAVSYYSFLHELGHAQHFFSAYFTPKITYLDHARREFKKNYDQALEETLSYARRNTREPWSSLYWNMPFEREANDFAVELFRSVFAQE